MRFARTAAIAVVVLLAALAAAVVYAAHSPSISKLHASPASLPSAGGHVTVSAHLKHSEHCTLSASLHIAKLPHTVACKKSTVTFHVDVPANATTAARTYTLKLKASSGRGSATAHVTVKVAAAGKSPSEIAAEEAKARGEREAKEKAETEAQERKVKEETEARERKEKEETEAREREEKEEQEAREQKEKEEKEEKEKSPAVQVATGEAEACAVLANGKVYCWGEDDLGQLGNGKTETEVLTPTEVKGIDNAKQVSIGKKDTCALLSTGHVDCWGENGRGQVGNEKDEEASVSTPVEVNHLEHVTEIQVGWDFACALIEGGTVKCWGENGLGNIGSGRKAKEGESVLVPEEAKVKEVSKLDAYFKHACGLLTNGTLKCWGYDFFDELGNNDEGEFAEAIETPVAAFYPKAATDVSLGHYHTCIVESGTVECWGETYEGQLGDGSEGVYHTIDYEPQATGLSEAVEVASGYDDTCARIKSGHVYCWGVNYFGEVGDGVASFNKEVPVDTPTEVLKLSEAVQISAGFDLACAVVKGGQVYCWGEDDRGQVGDEMSAYDRAVDEPSEVKNLP